jgi:hypothetical protein
MHRSSRAEALLGRCHYINEIAISVGLHERNHATHRIDIKGKISGEPACSLSEIGIG